MAVGITLLVDGSATMRVDWGSETVVGGTPVNSSLACRVTPAIEIEGGISVVSDETRVMSDLARDTVVSSRLWASRE